MTDQKLMKLLRKDPAEGIHRLMDLYSGAVTTICSNFLYDCSEEDVDEAIADTFIKFWENLNRFQLNEKYSIKSYLYTIARNTARDKRRILKRKDIFSLEELELDLPAAVTTETEFDRRQKEAILHSCLAKMKEPDKSVFLYRYFYGFKIVDIGKKLDLSVKKVENILYRGKLKLRQDLEERGIFNA